MQWDRDSTPANHILQERLLFSEEGSIVQYPHRVWGTHEISQADKLCLNETYSRPHIDKHLSDNFPIQNYLKQ
jgi:hypothetical protein